MKPANRLKSNRRRRKLRRDLRTLALFTATFCNKNHRGNKHHLPPLELPINIPEMSHYRYCAACQNLLNYALARRLHCPLDPKPACRECPRNCYAQKQRVAIREVMSFAGPYLVKRGRFDLLWRLRFG
jgi:hypothetical protein